MKILGISAMYHDSAAALIIDGEIIAAMQEERFTRIKNDYRFPIHAIKHCLHMGNINASELDAIIYYDNPFLMLDRYLKNVLALGKEKQNMQDMLKSSDEIFSKRLWIHKFIYSHMGLENSNNPPSIYVTKHHIAHAASAFYPSPYEEAVIITIDGVGEWDTTTVGFGRGGAIQLNKIIKYPHSLGLLYSAFTYLCGFRVNSGDYKFMGLAPYGKPIYVDVIKDKIIDIKDDGSFRLNMEYFDYQNGRTMISSKMTELFGERRQPESLLSKREMDIASSVQKVIEEVIIKIASFAKSQYQCSNLVLAGGVALNCVANGKLLNTGVFDNIWIQPAAGDAGGALGAAYYGTYALSGTKRVVNTRDSQKGSFLGISYQKDLIKDYLLKNKYPYKTYCREQCCERIASLLKDGKIIGLFQGRMEYGPRALGNRSIIASPIDIGMQSKLNLKIKYRESFRPFAPAVLRESVSKYFNLDRESPYMLFVEDVKKEMQKGFDLNHELLQNNYNMLHVVNQIRSVIPAVTHVDYSARIQTVTEDTNPYFYRIIKEFGKLTGYDLVVNTSFNVRGEPIVCTPEDAYRCFMRTEMDVLVLENCLLYKEEQPQYSDDKNWREQYELD